VLEATMFGIADYPAFVIAVIVFLMIPGPGKLARWLRVHSRLDGR
jgi:hypothetical protein